MKKKQLWAILCVLVLAFTLAGSALADAMVEPYWDLAYSVDYDVYIVSGNGKGLAPHSGPGSNYGTNGAAIPDGTRVHIVEECTSDYGNKWGLVNDDLYWGWIYLADTSPTPVETWEVDYIAYILTDDGTGLNIRMGPDVHYDKIDGLVPDGTRLHVMKEGRLGNGKVWGYVEYHNGKHGWLTLSYVTTEPPATPTPAPVLPATPVPTQEAVIAPVVETPEASALPPQQESHSDGAYTLMAVAVLVASVACLSVAAALVIFALSKKKNQ